MGWTGHSQSGLHKPLTPPEGREGGCSPCTGRHSLADVLCCAHVLLTQLPQLPVSQPSTTAAPKGSEHPLTPQHFAKAHSHSWRAQSQSHESPTPPKCLWAPSCPGAGAEGHRSITQDHPSHTEAVPPPREPEHTHTLLHSNTSQPCQGAVGQLLTDWVGSQRAPVPPRPLCKLHTLQRAAPLPSQGGCPARKGWLPREQSQRAGE